MQLSIRYSKLMLFPWIEHPKQGYGDEGRNPAEPGRIVLVSFPGVLRSGTYDAKLIIVSGGRRRTTWLTAALKPEGLPEGNHYPRRINRWSSSVQERKKDPSGGRVVPTSFKQE